LRPEYIEESSLGLWILSPNRRWMTGSDNWCFCEDVGGHGGGIPRKSERITVKPARLVGKSETMRTAVGPY